MFLIERKRRPADSRLESIPLRFARRCRSHPGVAPTTVPALTGCPAQARPSTMHVMWVLWCAYGLLAALGLGFAGWFMYAHFRRGARGPLDDLDAQSRSIFDELEPEGTQTDFFPGKGPPPSEYLL